MPEHPTDAHFLFTFVFKQALNVRATDGYGNNYNASVNNE